MQLIIDKASIGDHMLERLRPRAARFRVLPVMLLASCLMLTVKVGDVWDGFSDLSHSFRVSPNQAQAQAPIQPATGGKPGGKPGEAPADVGDLARDTGMAGRDPTRFSQSEIDLLQALAARRDVLEKRERSLDQREALLLAAEKRLEDKMTELDAIKLELQALLARHNEQEDGRLRSLVRIYEAMKPKEAAQIFDKLEMGVLLGVVERMKENKVAPILASMQPERAKAVTAMLADRSEAPVPNSAARR